MSAPAGEITQWLIDWRNGDKEALEKLAPRVYGELHRLARHYMAGERSGHTLQSSDLINELYLRLIDHRAMDWQNRAHFFAVAAQAMRHILVDYARARNTTKRGAGIARASLDEAAVADLQAAELVDLDEALQDLAVLDPRKSQVVELRYFGGLSVEETARVLSISPVTVMREWRAAKAWLLRALTERLSA
jgi:RNA polymerase sigma factor (TIGR02999 family)